MAKGGVRSLIWISIEDDENWYGQSVNRYVNNDFAIVSVLYIVLTNGWMWINHIE